MIVLSHIILDLCRFYLFILFYVILCGYLFNSKLYTCVCGFFLIPIDMDHSERSDNRKAHVMEGDIEKSENYYCWHNPMRVLGLNRPGSAYKPKSIFVWAFLKNTYIFYQEKYDLFHIIVNLLYTVVLSVVTKNYY